MSSTSSVAASMSSTGLGRKSKQPPPMRGAPSGATPNSARRVAVFQPCRAARCASTPACSGASWCWATIGAQANVWGAFRRGSSVVSIRRSRRA